MLLSTEHLHNVFQLIAFTYPTLAHPRAGQLCTVKSLSPGELYIHSYLCFFLSIPLPFVCLVSYPYTRHVRVSRAWRHVLASRAPRHAVCSTVTGASSRSIVTLSRGHRAAQCKNRGVGRDRCCSVMADQCSQLGSAAPLPNSAQVARPTTLRRRPTTSG